MTDKQPSPKPNGPSGPHLLRSPDVIQALKNMLAQAERGEVIGLVAVSGRKDGALAGTIVGAIDRRAIMGELNIIRRILEDMEITQRQKPAGIGGLRI